MKLSFAEKYAAIGKPEYEGLFITAVTTTGVFCRPGCRARKPKIDNVTFYKTAQEALQNGFRPCKICRPMEHLDKTPKAIKNILQELQNSPDLRLKDRDLRLRGLAPASIRRWFKRQHKMTFHAYQRMLRINSAFHNIKAGQSVTQSGLGSGYDSISGFSAAYQGIFGTSPSRVQDKKVITLARFTTPLGPMFAAASEKGLCLLEFTDRRSLKTEFRDLCRRLNAIILPGNNFHLEQVKTEILEYFSGNRKKFTIALDAPGTDFQKIVWKGLSKISYGQTRSYKELAKHLGKPKAIRAVARANGQNRIGIIIPCHRVIGAYGNLKGYGGGLTRKKWLLDLEAKYI